MTASIGPAPVGRWMFWGPLWLCVFFKSLSSKPPKGFNGPEVECYRGPDLAAFNPRPDTVFRHLCPVGATPLGVSKRRVVELKDQQIALTEYSRFVVLFLVLGQCLIQLWQVKGQIFGNSMIFQLIESISAKLSIVAAWDLYQRVPRSILHRMRCFDTSRLNISKRLLKRLLKRGSYSEKLWQSYTEWDVKLLSVSACRFTLGFFYVAWILVYAFALRLRLLSPYFTVSCYAFCVVWPIVMCNVKLWILTIINRRDARKPTSWMVSINMNMNMNMNWGSPSRRVPSKKMPPKRFGSNYPSGPLSKQSRRSIPKKKYWLKMSSTTFITGASPCLLQKFLQRAPPPPNKKQIKIIYDVRSVPAAKAGPSRHFGESAEPFEPPPPPTSCATYSWNGLM